MKHSPTRTSEAALLRHSLTYLIRQADAAVTTQYGIIVEEFFYNLLGIYILPIIVWRHGWIGARNRRYIGCHQAVFIQMTHITMFLAFNILYFLFHDMPDFRLSLFELLVLDSLNILRVLTIAVKYSTYTISELRELDTVVLSDEKLAKKLVLAGWLTPSEHLLYLEMERAIARTCPHLSKQRIAFPDTQSRMAVLDQLAHCLPLFLHYEAGCPAAVGSATPQGRQEAIRLFCEGFDGHANPDADVQQQQQHSQQAGAKNISGSTVAAMETVVNGVADGVDTPKAETDSARSLPELPAKLVLWHVITTGFASTKAVAQRGAGAAALLALLMAFSPTVIRLGMNDYADGVHPAAIVAAVLFIEQTFFYLFATVGFVAVGVLDLTRKVHMAHTLHGLLDTTATIALRMHDEITHDLDDYVGRERRMEGGVLNDNVRRRKPEFEHMDLFPAEEDVELTGMLNSPLPNAVGASHFLAKRSKVVPNVVVRAADGPAEPACSCGNPECTVCQHLNRHRSMARVIRTSMVSKLRHLTPLELHEHILSPSSRHVSLPVMYPQNIIAWGHVRNAAMDVGRSFYRRILIFTAFFAIFVVGCVVFSFFLLTLESKASANVAVAVAVASISQAAFGSGLSLQIVQGARCNLALLRQQFQLNQIESLVFEYIVTAKKALPMATRERLLQVKKVAASVVQGLTVQERLNPARVMGLPATFGLLGTMASVTLSGLIAAYQTLASSMRG